MSITPNMTRPEVEQALTDSSYRAGLAEGFRRGVQAAADVCEEYRDALEANGTHLVAIAARTCANRIRALRPEGETK